MTRVWCSAIYCDDIRGESGGKISLMGVMTSHVFSPSFPAVMQRLRVFVEVSCVPDHMLNEITLELFLGSKTLSKIEIPPGYFENGIKEVTNIEGSGSSLLSLRTVLSVDDIQLVEPSDIRLIVMVDGEALPVEGLKILASKAS